MRATEFFRSIGLTTVAGRTYPNTYAVAKVANFMAEQVANRDSATWKKAEHIVIEDIIYNESIIADLLKRWIMLTSAEPYGLSNQKLYLNLGDNRYAKYNADGSGPQVGTIETLCKSEETCK